MTRSRAAATVGAVAVVFGVVDLELWHSRSDTVYWLGNISSTYLTLAFFAGAIVGRSGESGRAAAAAGYAAMVVALLCFYGWGIGVHDISTHDTARVIWRYLVGGLVTGPIFGVLGARYAATRAVRYLLPLAAAFALEPLAWTVWGDRRPMPAAIPVIEVAVAAIVVLIAYRRRAPTLSR